ncbi:hypothetical protein DFH29DRAFT_196519 [Suillus ampliporus]|nr:hypothetical protein DFH29DRAFT_196519 [Suillus ampliporus]
MFKSRREMTVDNASDSSSMADNETEAERSQHSELSAPAPKKKRTRTLTTPHQSAVLHALLAQSRFPTTAMREEVGRQIGLSARKVQIWFQNQRQKARRPQSDSAPLSRPFPTVHVPPSLEPGLSGPGIPGRHTSEEYPRLAPVSPESTSSTANSSSRSLDELPSLTLREPAPRLLAPRPFLLHHGEQSPPSSRVLPPIHLESRFSIDPYVSSTSITHHHEPTRYPEPRISSVLGLPPPFALQPQPQWDPNSFAPYTRPEFASFSSPPRSVPGSFRDAPHVSPELARNPSSDERRLSSLLLPRPFNTLRNPRGYPASAGDSGMPSDDDEPRRIR